MQALAECEAGPVMGLPYALDVRVPEALWALVREEGDAMTRPHYQTYDALVEGKPVYTLLALDGEDAQRRVEAQLGRRHPELVAQWRAEGRQVRRRGRRLEG